MTEPRPLTITAISPPSPNQGARPAGMVPSLIVLHADAAAKLASSLDWIRRRESKVSYHYLVGREGHVYECVSPERRAWHAGVSEFGGVRDCNDYSVGVCLSNNQLGEAFAEPAIQSAARLCARLMGAYPAITLQRITTHAVVARPVGRKHDPGPLFPFDRFLELVSSFQEIP